jgi:hypothetical protein
MTRLETIGQIGEQIVQNVYGGVLSEDKYDSVKDLVLDDGTLVEVKTQPRWQKENCFTLDYNKKVNYNKCLNVDKLIFVEPTKSGFINIYEAPEKGSRHFYEKSVGRNKKYCISISDCKLAHRLYLPEENSKLVELTRTPWRYLSN